MKRFTCLHCGYCCKLKVKLSILDCIRIFLVGYRNFSEHNMKGELCIRRKPDGDCFFLLRKPGKKTCCKIYPIRPKMCRNYPGINS